MIYDNLRFPKRKNMRLQDYDYSREGLYFITICVQDRRCLFGKITRKGTEGVKSPLEYGMVRNAAGQMVVRWYHELENKFPMVQCHEMIVMPNHFHCIIEILDPPMDAHVGAPLRGHPLGNPVPRPTLGNIVNWFKTMSTNEYIRGVKQYGWKRFYGKLWQRNYYDHIIRNEKSYFYISHYIINNPSKWKNDRFYSA